MIDAPRAGCIVPSMRRHLALLAVGLAAACTDPTIEVELVFPGEGAGSLAEAVTRYDLAVVVANADCDAARYLELTAADLRRGTRVFIHDQPVGVPATLTDVPRVDDKLFVVTGYDVAGSVIAGGCAEVREPIEVDRRIPIPIEPALITRVIDSDALTPSLTLGDTDAFELLARERRHDGAPVSQAALRVVLRTSVGDLALATTGDAPVLTVTQVDTTDSVFAVSGLTRLPLDRLPGDHAPAGAAELVIRGAWSDEVNRLPVSIPVAPARAWLTADQAPNQIAPSWVTFDCAEPIGCLNVAALYQRGAGPPQLVSFHVTTGAMEPTRGPDLPGARALVAFQPTVRGPVTLATRTSTGWTKLDFVEGAWQATPGDEVTVAADQLLAFPPCGSARSVGLLSITGTTARGYLRPEATPAADSIGSGQFAAAVQAWLDDGEAVELLGAACVRGTTSDGELTIQPALAVRRTSATQSTTTLLTTGPSQATIIDTNLLGAVTAAALGTNLSVIATAVVDNGLRVQSYRLTRDARLVSDGVISHPVPATPTALATLDANGDDLDDTVALVPVGADLGVAMTLGGAGPEDAISATLRLPTTDRGQRVVALGQRDAAGHQRLLVLGADGLGRYDFAPLPP